MGSEVTDKSLSVGLERNDGQGVGWGAEPFPRRAGGQQEVQRLGCSSRARNQDSEGSDPASGLEEHHLGWEPQRWGPGGSQAQQGKRTDAFIE